MTQALEYSPYFNIKNPAAGTFCAYSRVFFIYEALVDQLLIFKRSFLRLILRDEWLPLPL